MVAVAPDIGDEPLAEGVHHRTADTVQAAGNLVATGAELAAGVQFGERERQRADVLGGMLLDRDATAVVTDPAAAVGQQLHGDQVAVTGQGLVHCVVDDLVDQMMQTALTGGADVHAGALADRFQTLQHLDRGGVVVALRDRGRAALAGQDVVGFLAGNRLHRIDVEEFAVVFVPALTLLIAHGQTAPVINLAHTSTPKFYHPELDPPIFAGGARPCFPLNALI